MITATDLRKSFGTLTAVDGVSLDIARGECFGLLGPNGAGKSTTLHMLVGLLKPDGGTVTVDGTGDPSNPVTRRVIGIAPQKIALYEALSARQNLAFFGTMYGLRGAGLRGRVQWALELAGLTDRAGDPIQTHSGGMQRRLNLACALVHEPKILLCDEPTVGIDPQSRNHIFETIERLKDDGLTILYTTHYMEEATRLCDRIGIIDHGSLLATDTVDGLIERHAGVPSMVANLRAPPGDPASLPGTLDGLTLRVETTDPLETAAALQTAGVDVESITTERPGLEDVFLRLTGRSLRDD